MLPSTLLVATSLLVAGASAQMNYTPPPGFNAGLVEGSEKSAWCQGQLNTCPKICGGFARTNRCDAGQLTFECVCRNGTVPNVASYTDTLPFFICNANFGQCIKRHPNDLDGQKECTEGKKLCGTLKASDSEDSTTTTTRSTATASPTTSETEDTTTTATDAAATTTNAAAALNLAQNYSLGILATLVAGAFSFLL